MSIKLLLPPSFKWIGLIVLIPFLVLGYFNVYQEFHFSFLSLPQPEKGQLFASDYNLTNEIALTGVILGLLMIAFARLRMEDEYTLRLRLESLLWAVLINYALLLVFTWIVNGGDYLQVMMYNMLTVPVIFIIRFYSVLWINRSSIKD